MSETDFRVNSGFKDFYDLGAGKFKQRNFRRLGSLFRSKVAAASVPYAESGIERSLSPVAAVGLLRFLVSF